MTRKYAKRRYYPEYLEVVRRVLKEYAEPVTCRQIYYRLISDPYIFLDPNNKGDYDNLLNMLVTMRELGDIDWKKIIDPTRGPIGGDFDDIGTPDEYIQNILEEYWRYYGMPMWETQENYLEIWMEKRALARVIGDVANGLQVLILPLQGWGSFPQIKEGFIRFREQHKDKEKVILYFGDHDPTGLKIDGSIQDKLYRYGFEDLKVKFHRIALKMPQIEKVNMRSLRVKKGDPNAKEYMEEFGDNAWEVDGLSPKELKRLTREAIEHYIDPDAWNKRKEEMEEEQNYLKEKMKKIGEGLL